MDRRSLVLVLPLLGLMACSRGNQSESELKLTSDQKLDDAIVDLWNKGGRLKLSQVVSEPFDELLVFPETTSSVKINEAAGQPLLKDKFYHSSTQLFLFRQDGRAVRATMVSPDVFKNEIQNARFDKSVTLVAPGGKQQLTLVND